MLCNVFQQSQRQGVMTDGKRRGYLYMDKPQPARVMMDIPPELITTILVHLRDENRSKLRLSSTCKKLRNMLMTTRKCWNTTERVVLYGEANAECDSSGLSEHCEDSQYSEDLVRRAKADAMKAGKCHMFN